MNDITSSDRSGGRVSFGKLAFGIALLTLGIVAFTDAADLWNPRHIWRLWPLALIFIGLANEADALRNRANDGSYFLLACGVWMFAATQRFYDLTYWTALPLGIAVCGLAEIVHALIDLPATQKKENQHEPC